MSVYLSKILAASFLLFNLVVSTAFAQPLTPEQRRDESRAAMRAAYDASVKGPADIALLDEAVLHLPRDMIFVPSAEAARLLRSWGNRVQQPPEGVVLGTRQQDDWATVIRFVKEGYIKDDDARDWKADDLLNNIREATDEGNEDRRQRGFPEVEVVGWITPPAYDANTHRLVSSVAKRSKGAAAGEAHGVNYSTFALGRNGYFSLDMLTTDRTVNQDKPAAAAMLAGLEYKPGHGYGDFNASTDHIAEYGLAALVGAVAVKKLGLIALAGAFVLKFAKLFALGAAAVVGIATRMFRRKA